MKKSFKKTSLMFGIVAVAILVTAIANTSSLATELPFLENGKLYKSRVGDPVNLSKTEIVSDVWKVLDYNREMNSLLYITKPTEWGRIDGNLWLLNTMSWASKEVATGVIGAQMSPDRDTIVIWNKDHEIWLITAGGAFVEKIGIHGAAPIFSHDGRYVAYEKLADSSFDGVEQSLFEFAQGMAIYDLESGQEVLLTQTEHGEDYSPVGFSPDLEMLYFNSTRTGTASLWSVNTSTRVLKRLSNVVADAINETKVEPVPTLSQKALWSSNRKIAISSIGMKKEVWIFRFNDTGDLAEAKLLIGGEFPYWLVKDKTIAFSVIYNGKSKWQTMDIQ